MLSAIGRASKEKQGCRNDRHLPAEFLMEKDRFVADLVLSQEVSFLSNTLIPERSKLAWLEGFYICGARASKVSQGLPPCRFHCFRKVPAKNRNI